MNDVYFKTLINFQYIISLTKPIQYSIVTEVNTKNMLRLEQRTR